MDCTKWTSNKRLVFTLALITTLTAGAIISYFCKNHTQTAPQPPIVHQTVALPADTARKIATPHIVLAKKSVITETTRFKSSIIHRNLEYAAREAGLTKDMAQQLNAMFKNAPISPIHKGERLNVLYHEYFLNDQKDHPGHIIAAEIIDGRKRNAIVRFTAPNHHTGYYAPNGNSTKSSFLKAPLHYKRVGSQFNYRRLDPVLHKIHPHLGVDFDAPMGTPVKAIANGIVVSCKQIRGYGNTLMIQYNKTYKAFYAHLEKFAGHVKTHAHVEKGQVVGYVGETGYTTGPHLHYAIYKNGKPVNPLTVKLPHGSAIPAKFRQDFRYHTDHLLAEMHLFEGAALADNESTHPSKRNS